MIVDMKKIFVVMQAKDAEASLDKIREQGVVHLENVQPPAGENIAAIESDICTLSQVLSSMQDSDSNSKSLDEHTWKDIAQEFLFHTAQVSELAKQTQKREALICEWEPWDNFNPDDIKALENKGVYVSLMEIPIKEISSVEEKYIVTFTIDSDSVFFNNQLLIKFIKIELDNLEEIVYIYKINCEFC